MLMKCKTCEKQFVPARKNIQICNKCIIFKKKQKTNQKKKRMNHIVKVMNKIVMKKKKNKKIEHKQFNKNQISNGEPVCGSVIID